MLCYVFLRNVVDRLRHDRTAYYMRFGCDFKGPRIPFGAEVHYKPSSPKDIARLPSFGCKMLLGMFLYYDQRHGGSFSGDLWVIDQEELEAAQAKSQVYPKRIKAPEVQPLKKDGKFRFPLAEGELMQPELTTKMKEKIQKRKSEKGKYPGRGTPEDNVEVQEFYGPPPPPDYWSSSGSTLTRHHRTPRVKLFMPDEPGAECPIPLKYLDVTRRTETSCDSSSEKCIRDLWVDNAPDLSEPWLGKTVFDIIPRPAKEGHQWVNGRHTKVKKCTRWPFRPPNVWPEDWGRIGPKHKQKAIDDWNKEKPLRDAARAKKGLTEFVPPDDKEYEQIIKDAQEKLRRTQETAPVIPVVSSCLPAIGESTTGRGTPKNVKHGESAPEGVPPANSSQKTPGPYCVGWCCL